MCRMSDGGGGHPSAERLLGRPRPRASRPLVTFGCSPTSVSAARCSRSCCCGSRPRCPCRPRPCPPTCPCVPRRSCEDMGRGTGDGDTVIRTPHAAQDDFGQQNRRAHRERTPGAKSSPEPRSGFSRLPGPHTRARNPSLAGRARPILSECLTELLLDPNPPADTESTLSGTRAPATILPRAGHARRRLEAHIPWGRSRAPQGRRSVPPSADACLPLAARVKASLVAEKLAGGSELRTRSRSRRRGGGAATQPRGPRERGGIHHCSLMSTR